MISVISMRAQSVCCVTDASRAMRAFAHSRKGQNRIAQNAECENRGARRRDDDDDDGLRTSEKEVAHPILQNLSLEFEKHVRVMDRTATVTYEMHTIPLKCILYGVSGRL